MSASQLFAMRNKIQKGSIEQFKQYLTETRRKSNPPLDSLEIQNLFRHVFGVKARKQLIEYLRFFAELDKNVLDIQINKGRRLLQEICFCARNEDLHDLIELFLDMKASLHLYSIEKLVAMAIDGDSGQESIVGLIYQLIRYRKYFPDSEEQEISRKDENYLCLKALKNDMLLVAYEIVKNQVGQLSDKGEQLLVLPQKLNKKKDMKQLKLFQAFLLAYFDKSRKSPYVKDSLGKWFWQRMTKQLQDVVHEVKTVLQSKMEQRQPGRRSDNKVRSSLGQNQNIKQHNSQALHQNYRQRVVINIQTSEDELSIQREANKIYENLITEKAKLYKYQKKQKKEAEKQKRTGIMKSEELRYYLEEDIKMEVQMIKDYNSEYKQYFNELINKLKQKLSAPLSITLEVFGSFRTELCLPESDIDIAITSSSEQFRLNPIKLLEEIQYILEQGEMKQYIESVKFIKTATVPIIKVTCTEKYWNKKVDFTYQGASHNGLQSVLLIKSYLQQYHQLQALIFVLKKFIYLSNLCAPYLGGISSYGLILMIVAYIQQEYKTHEGNGEKILVADLLIGFLKFYGYKVNYVMKSIQIYDSKNNWQTYTGCLAPYNDPNNMMDFTPKLVIIDPLNENNNVGRPTHKIKQIQMAFEIAYISIHTFRRCGKKRRCESYRRIHRLQMPQIRYSDNQRPCCILKRMFSCTEKFINERS